MDTPREAKWKANKRNYITKYNKSHYYSFNVNFNKEKDADLIEYFSMVPQKNRYIKQLIRQDIAKFKRN